MNRTSIGEQEGRPHEGERRGTRPSERTGREETPRGIDLTRLRDAGRNLSGQLREQARKRPYAALGAAAGAGFVAGSLLGSRLGQVLVAASVGYFAKNMLEGDLVERLRESIEKLAHE